MMKTDLPSMDNFIALGMKQEIFVALARSTVIGLQPFYTLYQKISTFYEPEEQWEIFCISGELHAIEYAVKNYLNGNWFAVTKKNGTTILQLAAMSNNDETIVWLMQKGLKVDALDSENRTACHYAAMVGAFKTLRLLLKRHPFPQATDRSRNTILHHSARAGSVVCMQIAYSFYVSPISRNADGRNALHLAAFSGNPAAMWLAYLRGARSSSDHWGMGVVDCAKSSGNLEAIQKATVFS